MAMTPDQINADLARAFSTYASKTRRAGLVLGNRLAVLKREASLAHLDPTAFDLMARHHMEAADARMRSDVAIFHPVTVPSEKVS